MLKLLITLFFPCALFSFNDAPSCLYNVQVGFFPAEVARQSFDLFYVFQSQWDPIITQLNYSAKQVPNIMRERARLMRPNPLEYPFDPEKTKELLLAVEYEVFRNVMVKNYFYDQQAIRGMFDYIAQHQQGKIDACLEKKKLQRMKK